MATYTNIKKEAKAAVKTALEATSTGFPVFFKETQKLKEFSEERKIRSRRILIGASSSPSIVGAHIIGWTVDIIIQAVSDFNEYTEAEHEAICSPIEAFIEDTGLEASLTNTAFKVQVATPGDNPPDDFDDGERVTEYHVELDCLLIVE